MKGEKMPSLSDKYAQRIEIKEDLNVPIQYIDASDGKPEALQESDADFNRFLVHERETHGKRTQIKVSFEVWGRTKGLMRYSRFRNRHVVLSLPSGEQADLAIDTVRAVCAAMHGKVLCKRS
jgi:hypothetical protein